MVPALSVTVPGTFDALPGHSGTVLAWSVAVPGWSVTVPASSDDLPGSTGRHSRYSIVAPAWSDDVPASSVTVPESPDGVPIGCVAAAVRKHHLPDCL
jgi:hypothetical protein